MTYFFAIMSFIILGLVFGLYHAFGRMETSMRSYQRFIDALAEQLSKGGDKHD